jgi:hypothetical protein
MIGLALDLAAFVLLRFAGRRPQMPRQRRLGSPPASAEPIPAVVAYPEAVASPGASYRTCICGRVLEGGNPRKIHCSGRCKAAAPAWSGQGSSRPSPWPSGDRMLRKDWFHIGAGRVGGDRDRRPAP